MANPNVKAIDRITGMDGVGVNVGTDYDAVTITVGISTVRLERAEAELFARAYVAACWEAARCAERLEWEAPLE